MRMLQTIALTILFANAMAAEELIVYVSPEGSQEVIERNEMQYEEYKWHSFPNRIRIAKINIDLLKEPGKVITITPFDDVPAIFFTSKGIHGSKWEGERIQERVPEEPLKEAAEGHQIVFETLRRMFNVAELNIGQVFKDPQTGEYSVIPAEYETLPIGHAIGERFGFIPVVREDVEIITKVYGSIGTSMSPDAMRLGKPHYYTIMPLYNDAEYVIIYEWDNSKNHHLLDQSPDDVEAYEQSEMGQRYRQLREEKADYMARVAERIANRDKNKEQQE